MLDLIKFCRQQTGYLQAVSIENNEFPLVQTGQQTKAQTETKQNEIKTDDVSQSNEQINGGEDINQLNDWNEDDAEIPAGVTDTMLTATDFLEDNEQAEL